MTKMVPFAALLGMVALTSCDTIGQAMSAHTDVVARAAGHELTVEKAATLMAENPRLPTQPDVADAVANLWVDYILLATQMAEDTSLASLDMDALIQPDVDQAIVWKLRDEVVTPDTLLTEEDLLQLYGELRPGLEVRARHILLQVPPDAEPAMRDSVRSQIGQLRERAVAGEDFAALAEEHSQDPGSARSGGDLGFFGGGQMVPPFEEAAFDLEVGEISDVVETPFGYHIITVEERRLPEFEEVRSSFESQMKGRRVAEAEDEYIRQLIEPLDPQVTDDGPDVVRELARTPSTQLGRRASQRALVRYRGGSFTAGDFQDLARRLNPRQLGGFAGATDEQLEQVLQDLTRNKILVENARGQGYDLTPQERDSLVQVVRQQVRSFGGFAGVGTIQPAEGETRFDAIERQVEEALAMIIRGERNVIPLGPVAHVLRQKHGAQVYERTFPSVVERYAALRPEDADAAQGGPPPGARPPGVMPPGAAPQGSPQSGAAPGQGQATPPGPPQNRR